MLVLTNLKGLYFQENALRLHVRNIILNFNGGVAYTLIILMVMYCLSPLGWETVGITPPGAMGAPFSG
jgi:small-conductance mechanosensitive channel